MMSFNSNIVLFKDISVFSTIEARMGPMHYGKRNDPVTGGYFKFLKG